MSIQNSELLKKATKLAHILHVPAFRSALFQYRVAAAVEHMQMLSNLADFRSVVDIGANRGQFALVAHQCFPNAKIHSFEPLKEPAMVFRRVFADQPRVVLHELAIAPKDEEMSFHVSRADDSSSLLPIASLQRSLFPGTEEKEERTVSVKRLDSILCEEDIEQPALLKIDVQGFEREALQGCENLLTCFSHAYVECSFMELYKGQALAHEVVSFLENFGFALSGIYNLSYDKRGIAIQGDFLFERKNYKI